MALLPGVHILLSFRGPPGRIPFGVIYRTVVSHIAVHGSGMAIREFSVGIEMGFSPALGKSQFFDTHQLLVHSRTTQIRHQPRRGWQFEGCPSIRIGAVDPGNIVPLIRHRVTVKSMLWHIYLPKAAEKASRINHVACTFSRLLEVC